MIFGFKIVRNKNEARGTRRRHAAVLVVRRSILICNPCPPINAGSAYRLASPNSRRRNNCSCSILENLRFNPQEKPQFNSIAPPAYSSVLPGAGTGSFPPPTSGYPSHHRPIPTKTPWRPHNHRSGRAPTTQADCPIDLSMRMRCLSVRLRLHGNDWAAPDLATSRPTLRKPRSRPRLLQCIRRLTVPRRTRIH